MSTQNFVVQNRLNSLLENILIVMQPTAIAIAFCNNFQFSLLQICVSVVSNTTAPLLLLN